MTPNASPRLDDFLNWKKSNTPDRFDEACCGPNSLIWLAVREAARDPSRAKELLDAYAHSLGILGEGKDMKLAARHRGFHRVLSVFLKHSERKDLALAAEAFDEAWIGPPQPCEFDPRTLPEDKVIQEYGPHLHLGTRGDWVIYDILWHLQHSKPGQLAAETEGEIIVREDTPILANGRHRAFKLVTELLPGPAGLVTPDWWPMGLLRFRQESNNDFLESTQRLFTESVNCQKVPHRLRWRLEPFHSGGSFGNAPFVGRSAEGAVVCLALALAEWLDPKKPELRRQRVLNPSIAITVKVERDNPKMEMWTLKRVSSIKEKFDAADTQGIREVLVAQEQELKDLPPTPKPLSVATVGEAYLHICSTNTFVRAHQETARAKFDEKWDQVETPGKKAEKKS